MLLLVDLDGVVYRGSDAVPGVARVLAERAAAGDQIVYVTNNSMSYHADYVTRLAAMGAPVAADRIVSSARATALYIARSEPDVRSALVLGGDGLLRELAEVGLRVVPAGEAGDRWLANGRNAAAAVGQVDAVVVGLDMALTYPRLTVATEAVRGGARFIATNSDPVYPAERSLMPGAGALVAAIACAAGRQPAVSIGKPSPLLLEMAARAVGVEPSQAVMIGDSLLTDMPAARAVGARCVLMLTGITTRPQLEALPAGDRPTAVAADAAELSAALERLARSEVGEVGEGHPVGER